MCAIYRRDMPLFINFWQKIMLEAVLPSSWPFKMMTSLNFNVFLLMSGHWQMDPLCFYWNWRWYPTKTFGGVTLKISAHYYPCCAEFFNKTEQFFKVSLREKLQYLVKKIEDCGRINGGLAIKKGLLLISSFGIFSKKYHAT